MIEKKLTLAVIVAVAVQVSGVVVWAGRASARLEAVETRVAGQADVGERLARVEAQLAAANDQLARIEKKLDGDR